MDLNKADVEGRSQRFVSSSPTPTVVGEGCVGQKRSVPEDGPSGTESITRYGRYGPRSITCFHFFL